MMPHQSAQPIAVAGRIIGTSPFRIWSLDARERLQRQLRNAQVTATEAEAGLVILLRADWVYDQPLVKGLASQKSACVMVTDDGICVAAVVPPEQCEQAATLLESGRAPESLPRLTPGAVASSFSRQLSKRESPYLLPLTGQNVEAIEARVFSGSYKGVTDFVTLYLWPRPASAVTRICARAGITPNMVTSTGLVLVFAAMWAFWHGHYGWGLAAAWVMTFLDTVDGKLARVTLNWSKLGDRFDHLIDLIHPPFWWWAWTVGLASVGLALPEGSLALTVIIAGYILQRLEEGGFEVWFKVNPHLWKPFDSRFRLITARRNPNLAILTLAALAGRPDVGINVVAIWVAACFVIHGVRIVQAAIASRHGPLKSWLS